VFIYLHPETVVSNEDIAQPWVVQDGPNQFGVSISVPTGRRDRLRHPAHLSAQVFGARAGRLRPAAVADTMRGLRCPAVWRAVPGVTLPVTQDAEFAQSA